MKKWQVKYPSGYSDNAAIRAQYARSVLSLVIGYTSLTS